MALQYQTVVYSLGMQFHCVESYDSIFESLRAAKLKSEAADEMTWFQPIELTCRGEEERPMRVAFMPQSVGAIIDIPSEQRVDVAE